MMALATRLLVSALFSFMLLSGTCAAQPLIYAPLPLENPSKTQASNQPIADLLGELLGRPVSMRLYESHSELLDELAAGEIDITMLGPLPLLLALERDPSLVKLAMFREANGRPTYRCVIAAPVDGVQSLDEFKGSAVRPSLALTREASTCGPVAAFSILIDQGLNPDDFSSSYQGGHDDVALAVLLERQMIGGLKEDVAENWHGLGLRVLASSRQLPGMVLVGRAEHFSSERAEQLRQGLLALSGFELERLETGGFGFAEVDESLLLRVRAMRRESLPHMERNLP